MNPFFHRAAFGAGALAIAWIGAGALRTSPLALATTLLIGVFYLVGAGELRRFDQASAALERALDALSETPARLDDWLAQVGAALRPAVRQRIEGERGALPGPALAPYLAGLLVLLGMLGTFLGMVVTLDGTGLALERAADLPTMRDSLAAPIKGLGLAFGTSVAGVAASAMLGLMAALSRRQRLLAAQRLDAHIATTLRPFTRAHQREALFELQRQQARLAPVLAEQMQTLMAELASQARRADERLQASQAQAQAGTEAAYRQLAASVEQSLQHSLGEGARSAAAVIQSVVAATMDGLARETTAWQGRIGDTLQRQFEGLSARIDARSQGVADAWAAALDRHERAGQAQALRLEVALAGFAQGFEQRAAALVDTVAHGHAALHEQVGGAVTAQLDGVAERLDEAVQRLSLGWQEALARHEQTSRDLARETGRSMAATTRHFEQQGVALLQTLDQAHAGLQAALAAGDEQRLAAWTRTLTGLAATLQQDWQRTAEQTLARQLQICSTLESTAQRITGQAEAQARGTMDELGALVQAASQAPREAADLVAQLREKLSDSLVRDQALLEERGRMMATLATLLDAVQRGAGEQQAAIDRLLASTADGLAHAGVRFGAQVDAGSARMEAVAAQLTASSVDVASLGEAFGVAVDLFSQSSDRLMAHLQRVDETLGRSIARSDEQLAYYVAQAREVIDLSLMSQKQIVDDLQRIAAARAAQGCEA